MNNKNFIYSNSYTNLPNDFYENRKLFIKIIISSIPVILIGYILVKTNFIDELRNIKIIAWMTIIFGILFIIGLFANLTSV